MSDREVAALVASLTSESWGARLVAAVGTAAQAAVEDEFSRRVVAAQAELAQAVLWLAGREGANRVGGREDAQRAIAACEELRKVRDRRAGLTRRPLATPDPAMVRTLAERAAARLSIDLREQRAGSLPGEWSPADPPVEEHAGGWGWRIVIVTPARVIASRTHAGHPRSTLKRELPTAYAGFPVRYEGLA